MIKHNRGDYQMHKHQLFEALEYKDMEGMLKPTVHIDEFASKMGDDDDIVVLCKIISMRLMTVLNTMSDGGGYGHGDSDG